MKVALINAYARSNAGDGLLVDLAADLIREVWPQCEIRLVAMDPSSFHEYTAVSPIGTGENGAVRIVDLMRTLVTGRPQPSALATICGADIAVAVGGGYLRADHPTAALKSLLSHAVQGPTSRSPTPQVYLPQSIGPLPPYGLPTWFKRLRHASFVAVRDDRSLAELERYGIKAIRIPDLVVLEIAQDWSPSGSMHTSAIGGAPAVVARDLPGRTPKYDGLVEWMCKDLGWRPLVQSRGRGNDDPTFYKKLGIPAPPTSLVDELRDNPPGVVVSTRLHGSLQSILAGVPSIHLSYERKGWGAYEDLGIPGFVHNAREPDANLIKDQVDGLLTDPSEYWRLMHAKFPEIAQKRQSLKRAMRGAVE